MTYYTIVLLYYCMSILSSPTERKDKRMQFFRCVSEREASKNTGHHPVCSCSLPGEGGWVRRAKNIDEAIQ